MDRRKARHRFGSPNVRKPPGTPVTVNRSPYEGVRAGSQESSSPYKNWSDMRNAGFVEHRDINGNMEWVDKKTGKPAGKGGADQTEPQLVQKMDINGNYQMVDPKTGLKRDGTPLNPPRFPMKPQAGQQAKAATPEDPMAGRGTDVPDLSRIGTGDLPTNAELDAGGGLTRALTPEEASRVASFGLGDTSTPSIADEGRTLLDAYTDENGVTHGHAATQDEIDQLNKKEADLQHQAKLADEFNAYKKVTDKQEAGLSETQKAARDLEKPGVAEASREKAKAETNIDLLQMEDRLQKQRDEAEIAQIMADPSEHPATEDDQRLQNPVDRMRAATQRQTDRQQNRDRQELSSALTGAEIAGSAATGYLNGDLSVASFQQEAAKETEGANIAQVANDTLGTLGIGSGTGEGSLTDSDVAKVNGETDTLSGMQNLDQMTAQIASQDSVQTEDEKEDQAAAKGGDGDRFATSRNFLATDKVPDTIFGYPVVSRREDYTQADIAFFEKHPEAGGYYDLGEEPPENEPTQATKGGKTRGAYPGSLNNPGNTGKHARKDRQDWTGEIDSPHARWAKYDTPQHGLLAAAVAVRKIADGTLKPAGKPFTIRNYAYKYAPPEENDTEAYIRNISRYSGLDPDAELDRFDEEAMARLLKAKVRFESGVPHSEWFTDDEYREAAEALQEGAYE